MYAINIEIEYLKHSHGHDWTVDDVLLDYDGRIYYPTKEEALSKAKEYLKYAVDEGLHNNAFKLLDDELSFEGAKNRHGCPFVQGCARIVEAKEDNHNKNIDNDPFKGIRISSFLDPMRPPIDMRWCGGKLEEW